MPLPNNIRIYHITHVDNLPQIVESGLIYSDAKRIALGLVCNLVGMSAIKQRRLEELDVTCCPDTKVGEYVPFYFCPRSIMLYLLHMGNHPDLTYTGGQQPMVHLEASLDAAVQWAEQRNVDWAFSVGNAGSRYRQFYNSKAELARIDWTAVANRDFRDPIVKEAKQSEFLMFESFPLELIEKIGIANANMLDTVAGIVENRTEVRVEPAWYY